MYSSRRRFLAASSVCAATAALGSVFTRSARAADFGDLIPDPDGVLDLPAGFSYTVVERVGDAMDDGFDVPGAPDGMACFEGAAGTLVLMRNHEIADSSGNEPAEVYAAGSGGGVTRVVVDAETGERISSNWVLAGTRRNCAGGPSPWGWLTCEENVEPNHGYVFACDPSADEAQTPQRIVGYGRCNHEAVAIDPATLIAYLTEDRGDGCLYRFVPDNAGDDPFTGTLQALRVTSMDVYPTEDMATGDMVDIDWVDVPDPDSATDAMRSESQAVGAANVRRGEGIWYFDGEIYFSCTSGGAAGVGQIFRLIDGPNGGTLECIAASTSIDEMNFPDNLTVAPWGQLFIAEDADANCRLLVIDSNGDVCPFARFVPSESELAGVCFSPDGQILFVNAQADGYTFAITGPFPEIDDGDTDTDTDDGGSTGDDSGDAESGSTSSTTSDGGSGSGSTSTTGDDSASSEGTDAGTDSVGQQSDDTGCGCSTSGDAGPLPAALALTVAAALRPRSGATGRGDPDGGE